jgi:hypothetical protein
MSYKAIASQTLSSDTTTVTFSSIPQNYRDLVLVISGRLNLDTDRVAQLTLNGNTGTNYRGVRYFSVGNIVGGSQTIGGDSFNATNFALGLGYNTEPYGLSILQFMDYTQTNKFKGVLYNENVVEEIYGAARAYQWAQTAAVTSISITANTGQINTGSTFALYGIEA